MAIISSIQFILEYQFYMRTGGAAVLFVFGVEILSIRSFSLCNHVIIVVVCLPTQLLMLNATVLAR